jgi:CRP-like cAMP-binding protein
MAFLSPIDLLSMSSAEQTILRCLTKHPQLTAPELTVQARMAPGEVEEVLGRLLRRARVVEQLRDGKRVFSTRFQFGQKSVRNMPGEILALLEQAPDKFLAEAPIAAVLDAAEAGELAQLGQKRTLVADEVLVWQGEKVDQIWLVQNGLLAQTRLKSRQNGRKGGYLHRGSWIGLAESLSESSMAVTYTAAAETSLLSWPAARFFDFACRHSHFLHAVAAYLSQQLRLCEQSRTRTQSKVWAVEGTHPRAGVTTIALNLAAIAQQQSGSTQTSTLFWPLADAAPESLPFLPAPPDMSEQRVGLVRITSYPGALHVVTGMDASGYTPQVQLDMILADLLAQYEVVVCDTGSDAANEFALRLRGQANTLITLTDDGRAVDEGLQRWADLQPYSYPAQKRVLALNRSAQALTAVDPRFHLVIPEDGEAIATALAGRSTLMGEAAGAPLTETLHEVFRRLSLNHTVALFVPSTMDVDQQTDNRGQVKAALSFLGNLFGGATSSNAEGAWRSEESGLVTEEVTIVRTFVSKQALDSHLDDVIHFATDLKRDMKQEAVAISVDNQLILV